MRVNLTLICLIFAAVIGSKAHATSHGKALVIGYIEVEGDLRYEKRFAYARIRIKSRDRPRPGAGLAIRNSRSIGRALNIRFSLQATSGKTVVEIVSKIERMVKNGIHSFLIDADARAVDAIASATGKLDLLLFNISAQENRLRAERCNTHLMHVIPSYAMMTDALAQFLVSKRWRKVLLLKGPLTEDASYANSFQYSAKRFGIKIIGERDFVLGNDPRNRDKNNISLLTAGSDYDAVIIADTDGEFGRYVPFQTNRSRIVLGTEGLRSDAWHWSWERHGAPQLNQRFDKFAKRRMQGRDWAAWIAIRAIIESAIRTKSNEIERIQGYLNSEKLKLDGYKGKPLSFRSWDNQLRQPILLHTHNAVIEMAPIKGFLHPKDDMDTLGYDKGDQKCKVQMDRK